LSLRVHTALGPGLLESAYSESLVVELSENGLEFEREVPLKVHYHGRALPVGYRLDLVVRRAVVVEVKSVDKLAPVHSAQLLSYLRLGGYDRGLLLNFGEFRLRDGIKRIVNGWKAPERSG